MKTESKLAKVFKDIAAQEHAIDSTASRVLAICKDVRALDGEKFDALVRDAYEANGWNTRPGRPNGDSEPKMEVPATVRTYVTTVRRAIRVGLKVTRYSTFGALRVALIAKTVKQGGRGRTAAAAEPKRIGQINGAARLPKDVQEDFVGVSIEKPKDTNGALFHDLAAVFIGLPDEHRDVLGRQLSKLLMKYRPLATLPLAVPPPAASHARKAA